MTAGSDAGNTVILTEAREKIYNAKSKKKLLMVTERLGYTDRLEKQLESYRAGTDELLNTEIDDIELEWGDARSPFDGEWKELRRP